MSKQKTIRLDSIHPNPDNPRQIRKEKLELLIQSLKDFPEMMELRPMVIDEDNVIIGGNMRYEALKQLGYTEVPASWVKKASHLTPEQKREFVIKDNNSFGEWDWDLLANEWDDLPLADWGIDLPDNFADLDLSDRNEDALPNIKTCAMIREGDIFLVNDTHRIMCGDATSVQHVSALMNGAKADMVFTDPPYNVNYEGKGKETKRKIQNDNLEENIFDELLDKSFKRYKEHTKSGAGLYVFHASTSQAQFEKALRKNGFQIRNQLIWNKPSMALGWGHYQWKHEPFFYASHEGESVVWYGGRTRATVWDFQKSEKELVEWAQKMRKYEQTGRFSVWTIARESSNLLKHPTQKPVELIRHAIQNSSKSGDVVLDLFIGSGSALVACEQTKRTCYGMDLEPYWIRVTLQRMRELFANATFECLTRKFDFNKLWTEE